MFKIHQLAVENDFKNVLITIAITYPSDGILHFFFEITFKFQITLKVICLY